MSATVLQELSWTDLTMMFQSKLVILMLALTLHGQVYAGEIYGGHEAVPHSRPYMVLVEQYMANGVTQHCGGFLLNEDFVMTAAHCQAARYTVFLGLHNAIKRGHAENRTVAAAFPHEDYGKNDWIRHDIMLLKLSTKANFSNHVKPIALADQADGSLPKSCMVSGWGRNDKNSHYSSSKLMEVNVTLTHEALCDEYKLYCSEGEIGPGQGDSGGPLVCGDGEAYGVVALSFEKGSEQTFHGYIKIPEYKEWISATMERALALIP